MNTNNSLSNQLEQINTLQENSVRIISAVSEAIASKNPYVNVTLLDNNNRPYTINIPTNVSILNELKLVQTNINNLIGLVDDGSGKMIRSEDGTFREVFVTNYKNELDAIDVSKASISTNIEVKNNNVLSNMMNPVTNIRVKLDKQSHKTTKFVVKKYSFSDYDFKKIVESVESYSDILKQIELNSLESNQSNFIVDVNPNEVRYSGEFEITSDVTVTDSNINLVVSTNKYNDSKSLVKNSLELDVDDVLVNSFGTVKYKIVSIKNVATNNNESSTSLKLEILAGVGVLNNGDKLFIVDQTLNNDLVIDIPVKMNERSFIFLQGISNETHNASPISNAIKFNSSEYIVSEGGEQRTFDDYFNLRVVDLSNYFSGLLNENFIPSNFGISPEKPILNAEDFVVTQINKHITRNSSYERVVALNKEKAVAQNTLDVINSSISDLTLKISEGNYADDNKKNTDVNLLKSKKIDKTEQVNLITSIISEIDSNLVEIPTNSIRPKYRLRGFWDIQDDIVSSNTRPQKIIQYEYRYRYTSINKRYSEVENIAYTTSNDIEKVGTVSTWNYARTPTLERSLNSEGNTTWVDNNDTDSETKSINMIDLPISIGESLEFQIRAISEAGYPNPQIASEWSNVIKKELSSTDIPDWEIDIIRSKNEQDVLQSRVDAEFQTKGVDNHLVDAYVEQEKTFHHTLSTIATSKKTAEQKTISAEDYMTALENKVLLLEEIVNRRYSTISVQVIDPNHMTYDVNHFSKLRLFAGNYLDEVDMNVESNYGTIVEKTFYIKLVNRNAQIVELLSLVYGGLNIDITSGDYNLSPICINQNEFINQKKGQIIYSRNKNYDNTSVLFRDSNEVINTIPTNELTTSSVNLDSKTILARKVVNMLNESAFDEVSLRTNASLSGYTTPTVNHPDYQYFKESGNIQKLKDLYNRLKYMDGILSNNGVQHNYENDGVFRFDNGDKFLVGSNSVGSAMYINFENITSYQVNGIDSSSSKDVYSGEQSALLIPITFQYRMSDAFGNSNGSPSTTANSNFEYSKTLGFDLLVGNQKFAFDLELYSMYRANSSTSKTRHIQVSTTNNTKVKLS